MQAPKVSIVLTSFNHDLYIREAIDSALQQDYQDFELIIWDDGSTDSSWKIISSYQDSRIRAIRSQSNTCLKELNSVIFSAQGQYIAIHHSDDYWEPSKLSSQVKILDENVKIGACFTHVQAINQHGKPISEKPDHYTAVFNQPARSRHEWLRYLFFHGNALCHPSVLIRRECYSVLGGYNEGFFQLPDYQMWIRLCLSYEIEVIPQKLTRFRVDAERMNSMSSPTVNSYIRTWHESAHALEAFRSISLNDLFLAFPESKSYEGSPSEASVIDYILAMVAINSRESSNIVRSFGGNLLTRCWVDDNIRQKLYNVHGLTRHQLIDERLLVDHSNIVNITNLVDLVNEANKKLEEKEKRGTTDSILSDLMSIIRHSKSHTILRDLQNSIPERSFHLFSHILYDIRTLIGERNCTYLEIGSYCGASALLMLSHPLRTEVLCVDPLNLPPNHFLGKRNQDETLYQNLTNFGLHQDFEIIKSSSRDPQLIEALYRQDLSIDILFIDGDHSYAAVIADFLLYEPLVASGGYIVFDDYCDHENSPGVHSAVNDIVLKLGGQSRFEFLGEIPDLHHLHPGGLAANEFIIYKR